MILKTMDYIYNASDMDSLAMRLGFLPFFRCGVPTLSIEEHTAPGLWFSDEEEGPWEWKGPVIREGHCAYGKLFDRKAGYVSLEWLPHMLNYRHSLHYAKDEDTAELDDVVLQAIWSEGSATVNELRRMLGFLKGRGRRRATDCVDSMPEAGKVSLEPILVRLMMGGRVVIADFEYNVDRYGRPYGWGVARYTTPEALYGKMDAGCTPEESRRKMTDHLCGLFPEVSESVIGRLIG